MSRSCGTVTGFSGLVFGGLVGFLSLGLASCAKAEEAAFVPQAPCPVDTFEECLAEKAQAFGLAVKDRRRPDFLVAAYEPACKAQDADACFALGSIFSGSEAARAPLPQVMRDAIPVDRERALAAYRKSCDLNSAMGCATLANFIAPDNDQFKDLQIADQIEFLNADKKSCNLGMIVSCDAYLDTSRLFEPENWPDGPRAFMLQESSVAAVPCDAGDEDGCFSQAIALMLSAKYTSSQDESDEVREAGTAQLQHLCDSGYKESCALLLKLEQE